MSDRNTTQPPSPQGTVPPSDQPARRPWRTEGLPKEQPSKRRGWTGWVAWFAGYLLLFGLLTMQDRLARPESVAYTEFKAQVAAANVAKCSRAATP